MKKRILTALMTGALVTAVTLPANAATLSDVTPDNSTIVTANIVDPGQVSYTITIPEKVDFGTLTQPDSDTDSYVFKEFQVVATELNIKTNQGVTVWMKDSSAEDNQFYITQKDAENPFQISYGVYSGKVDDTNISNNTPLNSVSAGNYGYHLCTFASGATGSKQDVTLALNQKALYGKTLSEIAGDYSGTISFHSALIEQ